MCGDLQVHDHPSPERLQPGLLQVVVVVVVVVLLLLLLLGGRGPQPGLLQVVVVVVAGEPPHC
jgi:hypothetical protein